VETECIDGPLWRNAHSREQCRSARDALSARLLPKESTMDLSRDIEALVTDFMVLVEQAVDRAMERRLLTSAPTRPNGES
jgi:hypothetical protein